MPAKKKRRTKSTLRSVGAIFGVMGDLYIPFDLIITAGMERSLAKGTPSSAYNRAQNQLWELYQLLTSFAPGLVAEIAARGPSGLYSVSEELHHGRTAGFNTMTFNAKRDVANWYSFDLALPTMNRKALRGFNHHGSGRLLCPSDFDYTKEAVRVGLRDNSPHYPRGPDRLPRLMWRDQHVNPNDFYEGFLEDNGPMLALTEILLGPSAAGEGGEFSTSKGGGSRPRASQFKIKSITPAAIACAIVLSHFSLSSQLVMSSGSTNSGRWPYHKFYRNVLACINSMPDNRRNELLAYWTRMVLGDVCVDDEDDEDDEHDTDDESLSSFTRMLAQAHAACLAAAAVVAATSNMPQTSASDVVAPLSQAPQHSPSPSTDSSSEPSSSRASPA